MVLFYGAAKSGPSNIRDVTTAQLRFLELSNQVRVLLENVLSLILMILGLVLTRTLAILRYTCIISEVRQYLLLDFKTIDAFLFRDYRSMDKGADM